MQRGKKPQWVKKLANERIETLLKLAEKNAKNHPERSKRYVELVRKISKRYNVTIASKWKKRFCKKCNEFWTSKTLKVRRDSKTRKTVYLCVKCNNRKRYG